MKVLAMYITADETRFVLSGLGVMAAGIAAPKDKEVLNSLFCKLGSSLRPEFSVMRLHCQDIRSLPSGSNTSY